jgi:hypothetical protein
MGLRGIGSDPRSMRTEQNPPSSIPRPLSHNARNWLLYGFDERWRDAFASKEEYEATWWAHRDELMQDRAAGRRPMGWWHVEARRPYPGYDFEKQYLFEHKLVDKAERAELLKEWREQFAKAQQPNFTHTMGPGRIFKGEEARAAHYAWANIPVTLIKKWEAERSPADEVIEQPTPAA